MVMSNIIIIIFNGTESSRVPDLEQAASDALVHPFDFDLFVDEAPEFCELILELADVANVAKAHSSAVLPVVLVGLVNKLFQG